MPEIRPFAGVRYRLPEAELAQVLAPPYDVIPPAYQDALYARDPRNVVRVVLNRTPGDAGYAEVGDTYRRLLAESVLAPDPAPTLYVLEQAFEVDGHSHTRLGLVARFRADDPERGVVLPHEQTRSAAKQDRWRVLLATRANFSPIFLMVPDAAGALSTQLAASTTAPVAAAFSDDAGVRHRLWCVTDAAAIEAFVGVLGGAKAYIADGHHRYATALRYRDSFGPEGAWSCGYFTPLEAPGLVVLPYHRILRAGPSLAEVRGALRGLFLLNQVGDVAAAARAAQHSTMPYAFGVAEPGNGALVAEALPEAEDLLDPQTPRCLRALDTYFLHRAVLSRLLSVADDAVSYVHSLAEAERAVAEERCRLALLMRATPVRQIVDVADARESMPAKSTFFHPKLPSGLVIHPLLV